MTALYLLEYMLGDYDSMDIDEKTIYTNNFTENMEEFEEINEDHQFISFLYGFSHNLFNIDITKIHGWYHKRTKQAKFFLHPAEHMNLICMAWEKYCKMLAIKNKEISTTTTIVVSIYRIYCGQLYNTNEAERDEKLFYVSFASDIIKHIANIECNCNNN